MNFGDQFREDFLAGIIQIETIVVKEHKGCPYIFFNGQKDVYFSCFLGNTDFLKGEECAAKMHISADCGKSYQTRYVTIKTNGRSLFIKEKKD